MVRKRGAYDRIEKVVSKKRTRIFSPGSETSANSSTMNRNLLNDRMLSLYKNDATINEESTIKAKSTPHQKEFLLEDGKSEEPEKTQNIERLSSKTGKVPEKKKASALFGIKHSTITFADVGGLKEILNDIIDNFFHLKDPELFTTLGVAPVGGFLLHGPPGCGKTLLARAIAGELNLPYIEVAATELVCGISGESESKIREMFDEAVKNAPCILFIDEIDAVIPKRETTDRGMERRMVTQMLKCLDELDEKDTSSNVMVIGATNRPDFMDQALRRGGRFHTEFAIGMPDEEARSAILQVLSKKLKLSPDFDMKWLAHHTPGYVGADLKSLITKAVTVGLRRIYKKLANTYLGIKEEEFEFNLESKLAWYKSEWKIPEETTNIHIELQDFQIALQDFVPYSKREGFAMVPNITWNDVGALKDIKKQLQKSVIWPIKYRKFYELSHMSNMSSKGILLYGPKGCGKTLLAKAIANECSINFLSVKGPELLGMYVGESEKKVRECFQRARHSAPCIIFFDEFDALCPKRSGSNTNAVAERVVNQLLTEMDGIEERKQVFVIGATNFLEKIDSAMLRPGRLEKIIYVGLPSPEDRVEILKSITKNKTKPKLSDDVDLKQIAFDPHCENFSGADMAYLVREAYSAAVEDRIDSFDTISSDSLSDNVIEIKLKHFEYAFSMVKPSVSEKDMY